MNKSRKYLHISMIVNGIITLLLLALLVVVYWDDVNELYQFYNYNDDEYYDTKEKGLFIYNENMNIDNSCLGSMMSPESSTVKLACQNKIRQFNSNNSMWTLTSGLLFPVWVNVKNVTSDEYRNQIRTMVDRVDVYLQNCSNQPYNRIVERFIDHRRRRGQRTNLKTSEFKNITEILKNDEHCTKNYGADLGALVVIITKPHDFDVRSQIRNTWAKQFSWRTQQRARLYFAFGQLTNLTSGNFLRRVHEEQRTYGDLIHFNFKDGYWRLTIKTVAILRWASIHCPLVNNILKTDIDSFLHYENFMTFIDGLLDKNIGSYNYEMQGKLAIQAGVIRNREAKWFTNIADYSHRTYPTFAASTWLISGTGLAAVLYRSAILYGHPRLLWEDAFVTGVLRNQLTKAGVPIDIHYAEGLTDISHLMESGIIPNLDSKLWIATQIPAFPLVDVYNFFYNKSILMELFKNQQFWKNRIYYNYLK